MSWLDACLFGGNQSKRIEKINLLEAEIYRLNEELRNGNPNEEQLRSEIVDKKLYFDVLSSSWNTENARFNRTLAVVAGFIGLATFSITNLATFSITNFEKLPKQTTKFLFNAVYLVIFIFAVAFFIYNAFLRRKFPKVDL